MQKSKGARQGKGLKIATRTSDKDKVCGRDRRSLKMLHLHKWWRINTAREGGSCSSDSSGTTDMQKKYFSDRLGASKDFIMWHDYLGLRAMVARLARSEDAAQLQSSSTQSGGLKERAWCPDATPETSGSGGRSPGSQGLGRVTDKSTCAFCRQNGESAEIYTSHRLKARNGRVLCPVLRSYVCPSCGATGDSAHTRNYCPASANPP